MPIQLSTPQKKSEPRAAPKLFSGLGRTSKVGTKDRLFFTEQLALLLETGTNLHAGLQSLQTQAKNPALRAIIDQIIVHISEGKTFSYALSCHPEVFSKTYVNLVAASESGGYMHQVLEQLLAMEEKREQLKATMMSALSYPVFLTVFSLAVVVFVLVVVFPKFSELFLRIADQLPATTKFLMAASNVFIHRWYLVLGGVGISVVGIVYLLRTEAGSLWVDRAKLKLPVVRDIFQQMYLSQVLRVMGLSLGNGVNILDSLRACKEIVDNRLFRK